MPTYGHDDTQEVIRRRNAARERVRRKFPALMEGSTGWGRAMQNELRKRL